MSDAGRIADSTTFKLVVPILQIILAASATGSFAWLINAVSTLQTTLNGFQTSQALTTQRVEMIERRLDASERIIDSLRSTTQRLDIQGSGLSDNLKSLVHSAEARK